MFIITTHLEELINAGYAVGRNFHNNLEIKIFFLYTQFNSL